MERFPITYSCKIHLTKIIEVVTLWSTIIINLSKLIIFGCKVTTFSHALFLGDISSTRITVMGTFDTDRPVYVLRGITQGGPPLTNCSWRKDGVKIRSGPISSYYFSTVVPGFESKNGTCASGVNTCPLIVIGRASGVFEYSVNESVFAFIVVESKYYNKMLIVILECNEGCNAYQRVW